MMLLCDSITLKNFNPNIIDEIKSIGNIIEI